MRGDSAEPVIMGILYSFDSCLNYALKHNIQIKIEESNTQFSKINYRQSYLNLLPSADAYANHNFNGGKSVDQSNYTYINQNYQSGSLGLEGRINLFNGFQDVNSILKNKYDLLAGYLNIDKISIDVTINVLNSYLNILYFETLMENAKSQYEVSKIQTEKIKLLMDLGKSSYKDLLEIKAQESLEKETLITTKNDLIKSRIVLGQYMNYDSLFELQIRKDSVISIDTSMIHISFNEIYNNALEQLPDLKIANYQLQSSERNLAIARGQCSPSLTLSGSYSSWYSSIDSTNSKAYLYKDQIQNKLASQVSLKLSIPIFNKYSLQNNISKAKVNVDISNSKYEQVKLTLYMTIQQLYIDSKNANAKYNSRKETLSSMEELYQFSEQQYQLGMLSSIDYKISKNNYSKSFANFQQAKFELIYKTKVLSYFITGKIGL